MAAIPKANANRRGKYTLVNSVFPTRSLFRLDKVVSHSLQRFMEIKLCGYNQITTRINDEHGCFNLSYFPIQKWRGPK